MGTHSVQQTCKYPRPPNAATNTSWLNSGTDNLSLWKVKRLPWNRFCSPLIKSAQRHLAGLGPPPARRLLAPIHLPPARQPIAKRVQPILNLSVYNFNSVLAHQGRRAFSPLSPHSRFPLLPAIKGLKIWANKVEWAGQGWHFLTGKRTSDVNSRGGCTFSESQIFSFLFFFSFLESGGGEAVSVSPPAHKELNPGSSSPSISPAWSSVGPGGLKSGTQAGPGISGA